LDKAILNSKIIRVLELPASHLVPETTITTSSEEPAGESPPTNNNLQALKIFNLSEVKIPNSMLNILSNALLLLTNFKDAARKRSELTIFSVEVNNQALLNNRLKEARGLPSLRTLP